MKYSQFENIISVARMNRYLSACANDTRKSMTLYRLNLKLSQEFFTIISCFEISLRNKIDEHLTATLGTDWLRNGAQPHGIFDNRDTRFTQKTINDAVNSLGTSYNHNKLVAELGFGFWRFLFAQKQYTATGRNLLRIFPGKPISTPTNQYNQRYVFNQLATINKFRNRIAHHEPICFRNSHSIIDSTLARERYATIIQFFQWMDVSESELLYGIDHVNKFCTALDNL